VITTDDTSNFRELLAIGSIQRAYRGLMDSLMGLRTHLEKSHPDHAVSALYQGYMDMSCFTFTPSVLQSRKLKIAIVFVYDKFRFEVWLSAANKRIQTEYWELIRQSGWDQYTLVPSVKGYDSILEHVLVELPDFEDPESLTSQIESGSLEFIRDVEAHLPFSKPSKEKNDRIND
jgi:hypothetical protein